MLEPEVFTNVTIDFSQHLVSLEKGFIELEKYIGFI
jgi:hypothetical protein